ncbi:hypothetical protein PAMP_010173 [Pampus punctatissimus]
MNPRSWSLKFVILTALQALYVSVSVCDNVFSRSAEEGPVGLDTVPPVKSIWLERLCDELQSGVVSSEENQNKAQLGSAVLDLGDHLSATVQRRQTAKQKHYGTTVPLQLIGQDWKPISQIKSQSHPASLKLLIEAEGEQLLLALEKNETD